MKVKPKKDRVFVEQDIVPEKTEGGILLTDGYRNATRPRLGTVRFVGPDAEDVEPGERVAFTEYAGNNITLDGETQVLVMRADDILCTVED